MTKLPLTFNGQLRSLFELYGRRNAMYLQGDARLKFLDNSVRLLGKMIRREETDKLKLGNALGSIFARTSAFADSFIDLPIVESMSCKYPRTHCAYCSFLPCGCGTKRMTEIQYAPVAGDQLTWTVGDWCAHMDKVYGINNRTRGIEYAISRLREEIDETSEEEFFGTHNQKLTLTKQRERLSDEFADVYAWIFTLANLLEINLETVLHHRYNGDCYRCVQRPCDCGSVHWYDKRANPIGGHPHSVVQK